jgi:hypothetical protein
MPPLEQLKTKGYKFDNFERVVELWRDRLKPEQLYDRLKVRLLPEDKYSDYVALCKQRICRWRGRIRRRRKSATPAGS